ncbi:MAG: uroporphyrinogen-III synthase [Thermoplasmata archaeon]
MDEIVYVGAPLENPIENVKSLDVLRITYNYFPSLREIKKDVVFTSKRGIISLKMNGTKLKSKRAFSIGHITSEYLKKIYGMDSIFPSEENSDGFADLLISYNGDYSLITSDSVSNKMLKKLDYNNIKYELIIAYRIEENVDADYSVINFSKTLLIGSSKSFEILLKNAGDLLFSKKIYAIGKPTYERIIESCYKPVKFFESPDIRKIVNQILTERI